MEESDYSETSLSTSNTKLAATLYTFGVPLNKHNPVTRTEEYSKAAVLNGTATKERGKIRWFFNFDPRGIEVRAIGPSFEGKESETRFIDYVKTLECSPKDKTWLLALHSAAMCQICREVQEGREYLLTEVVPLCPKEATMIVVRDQGRFITMGKNASIETRTRLLGKI